MSHDHDQPPQPLAHQDAWELIPWYVNGTLEDADAGGFQAHLERCPLCRREVELNQGLAVAVRDAGELPSAEAGLARVLERLDREPVEEPPVPTPRRGAGRLLPGWWSASPPPARRALAAGLAAVLLLAVALGAVLLGPVGGPEAAPPASFRTLSQPRPDTTAVDADGFRVRLVFSPSATEPQLRRLLLADDGRLVDGPSPAGVYTAAFPAGADRQSVLRRLRATPQVELAEPASRGSGAEPAP